MISESPEGSLSPSPSARPPVMSCLTLKKKVNYIKIRNLKKKVGQLDIAKITKSLA